MGKPITISVTNNKKHYMGGLFWDTQDKARQGETRQVVALRQSDKRIRLTLDFENYCIILNPLLILR